MKKKTTYFSLELLMSHTYTYLDDTPHNAVDPVKNA